MGSVVFRLLVERRKGPWGGGCVRVLLILLILLVLLCCFMLCCVMFLVGKYVFHVFTFRSNTSVFNVFTFALRIRERDVFNSYILTYFLLNLLIFTGISYVR